MFSKPSIFSPLKPKIVILGDIMIDRYNTAEIIRISPEAPLPIYNILETNDKLGGAGNLVVNLQNLYKDNSIFFVSVIGNDYEGEKVKELLKSSNIKSHLFVDDSRKTTVKNRIFCRDVMICRFDQESLHPISFTIESSILSYLQNLINLSQLNYLIISDYQKGLLTPQLCTNIILYCNNHNIPVFVDPKTKNPEKYKNVFLLKPNMFEANTIYGNLPHDEIVTLSHPQVDSSDSLFYKIYHYLQPVHLLVTNGADGMILYSNYKKKLFKHLKTYNTVDVTGCGDVVFAVLIYEYIRTKRLEDSIHVANYIGGKAVETIGTYICDIIDIEEYHFKKSPNKIFHFNSQIDDIKPIISFIKKKYSNIVFTNGCFDIVHVGHLQLLKYCKSLGDFLIVAINSDLSIKQIKGPNRPINSQSDRALFLSLLSFIDLIIIFDESTPFNLLETIKPHTMVKGGDYQIENIIGREFADNVLIYPLIPNHSTTNIINSIQQTSSSNSCSND